jgi:uncharacterized protein YyaL (SSP411 family)
MAYTQLLNALDFMIGPSREIVIAGDPALSTTQAMVKAVHTRFLPNKVLLLRSEGPAGKRLVSLSPFVEAMRPANGKPTAYVCEQYACKTPAKNVEQLESILN